MFDNLSERLSQTLRHVTGKAKLSFAEEVKAFVSVVSRYPYDMDLRAGRHVVDAKSILGIFSLDLSKPISLEVYADDCDDLISDLKAFAI